GEFDWQDAQSNSYGPIAAHGAVPLSIPLLYVRPWTDITLSGSLRPGHATPLVLNTRNDGNTVAVSPVFSFNALNHEQSLTLSDTAPNDFCCAAMPLNWVDPEQYPRNEGESAGDYLDRLRGLQGSTVLGDATISWQDGVG